MPPELQQQSALHESAAQAFHRPPVAPEATPENVTETSFDELMADYGSQQPTWCMALKNGKLLTLRACNAYDDVVRLQKKSAQTLKMLRKAPSDAFKPYVSLTDESIRAAVALSELCVSPSFTLLQAFELTKKAGSLVNYIQRIIGEHLTRANVEIEVGEIEAAGEE